MERMQEREFDKIKPTTKQGEHCSHDIVKLYINGTHSDYGCIKCKMKCFNKEDFKKNI